MRLWVSVYTVANPTIIPVISIRSLLRWFFFLALALASLEKNAWVASPSLAVYRLGGRRVDWAVFPPPPLHRRESERRSISSVSWWVWVPS